MLIMVTTRRQTGVGLIEILIALLVLSIGLLGMSALQINATKQSHSLMLRTQAISLAYDIADRLRVNADRAQNGSYTVDIADTVAAGTLDAVTQGDINDFFNSASALPGGDFSIAAGQAVGTGAARSFAIHICWRDPYSVLRDTGVNCGSGNTDLSGFIFMAGI